MVWEASPWDEWTTTSCEIQQCQQNKKLLDGYNPVHWNLESHTSIKLLASYTFLGGESIHLKNMDHLPRQGFCTFALKSNVTCSRLAPNCKSTQHLGERLVRLVHPFWASFSQFIRQFFDQLFGMLTKHTSFPPIESSVA